MPSRSGLRQPEKAGPERMRPKPGAPIAGRAWQRKKSFRYAETDRHPDDHDHRRGPDRHRPGLRVRLFRHPGLQGAARRGLPDRPRQFQSGDDHDRSGLADRTYVEPITPEIVAKIIEKERYAVPGGFALLPTMGGQTALNCALSLEEDGRAGKIRRRDDRRDRRGHRQGRGPRTVPRGDDQDRPRHAALASHQDADRRRWRRSTTSACPRSSARPSRWAAPAAASPTTRPNSSTSSSAASTPRRPTKS